MALTEISIVTSKRHCALLVELISRFPREESKKPMFASQFVETENGLKTGELLSDYSILGISKLEPKDCSVNDTSEDDDDGVDDGDTDVAVLRKVRMFRREIA